MIQAVEILPFTVAKQRGGIVLESVVEVLRASAISRLPSAPGVVEGIINVRGAIVPVLDLRVRFGLARSRLVLSDRFIIVRCNDCRMALRVDEVDTPRALVPDPVAEAPNELCATLAVAGVVKLPDDLILIYDAEAFLLAAERDALEQALAERKA